MTWQTRHSPQSSSPLCWCSSQRWSPTGHQRRPIGIQTEESPAERKSYRRSAHLPCEGRCSQILMVEEEEYCWGRKEGGGGERRWERRGRMLGGSEEEEVLHHKPVEYFTKKLQLQFFFLFCPPTRNQQCCKCLSSQRAGVPLRLFTVSRGRVLTGWGGGAGGGLVEELGGSHAVCACLTGSLCLLLICAASPLARLH